MITIKMTKNIAIILLLMGVSLAMVPVSATIFTGDGADIDEKIIRDLIAEDAPEYSEEAVVFFYDPECGACTPAHEFLLAYIEEHPDTKVQLFDLSNSSEERDRFNEFKKSFNRTVVYTPVLYIGPVAFEGATDIETYFEDVYSWYTLEE